MTLSRGVIIPPATDRPGQAEKGGKRRKSGRGSGGRVFEGAALQLSSAARLTAAMLHDPMCPGSVSILDTRLQDGQRTPAGLLHMYYMRLCSEKLLADIRGLCPGFSPSSSGQARGARLFLCLQGTLPESLCTWLVFELVASSRFEPSPPRDIVYPPSPRFLALFFFAPVSSSSSRRWPRRPRRSFSSPFCFIGGLNGSRTRTDRAPVHLAARSCDHCRHNHGKFDSGCFLSREDDWESTSRRMVRHVP